MKEERMHILQMVADGKITVDEADKLIEAIGTGGPAGARRPAVPGRFLRIRVTEGADIKTNVSIPLELAKLAMRFVPKDSGVRDVDVDEVIQLVKEGAQGKLAEIEDGKQKVEIYVE